MADFIVTVDRTFKATDEYYNLEVSGGGRRGAVNVYRGVNESSADFLDRVKARAGKLATEYASDRYSATVVGNKRSDR